MSRRSTTVQLTLLPMLASAAVASAAPPGATDPVQDPASVEIEGAPAPTGPVLQPPGMTPSISELQCEEDPNWRLRDDCPDDQDQGQDVYYYDGGYIRGGFGTYFGGPVRYWGYGGPGGWVGGQGGGGYGHGGWGG